MSIYHLIITLSQVSSQGHFTPLTPPDLACGTGKYTHLLSTLGVNGWELVQVIPGVETTYWFKRHA